MKNLLLQKFLLIMAILTFALSPVTAIAQDEGPLAMQTLAYYSLIGGGLGAVLGAALWAIDPLSPSSDISSNAYNGLSIGVIAATIWGISLMQDQAIIPYNPNEIPPSESEFNGDFGRNYHMQPNGHKKRRAELPLLGMQYRF